MNLLTEKWIPVELDNSRQRISLKTLLSTDKAWKLTSFRDDMELATIQLLVSLVQVCFMPKDKTELMQRLNRPLTSQEYQEGIEPFIEWFDLAHEKWPFMQTASVKPQKGDKNFSTLHKLFVGLPEKTSSSPSTNAFFNRIDEIETAHFGDVAVALFQQSTNGFSLGGASFSVGLKGGMPLTTLIYDTSLRKTIWYNILTSEFSRENKKKIVDVIKKLKENDKKKKKEGDKKSTKTVEQRPTWILEAKNKESVTNISLMRGLFWQPSKMKLEIKDGNILGFYTEPGLCAATGFWIHPHTPLNIILLKNNTPKEKPYSSLSGNRAIWSQMLCFFYSPDYLKGKEGTANAAVVTQYRQYFKGEYVNLMAGGYIKGKSAESLACRRHETFSLSHGWEDRASEMEVLIGIGNSFEKALFSSVSCCCSIAFPSDKPDSIKTPSLKQRIFENSKNEFFKNSEPIFHSILKQNDWTDLERFTEQLKTLTIAIYEDTTEALKADVKYFRGVTEGRRLLYSKIKEIENDNKLV
jgi:CRISPR system Cascade subunit CasA